MVLSPITNKPNVILEQKISTSDIINGYKSAFNIDVSLYFTDLNFVEIYKCLDTGYRFYYPFYLAGDGKFYDLLQKKPWYYNDWKWEYQIILDLFKGEGKLLEIGSGKGVFIKEMQATGKNCIGLELSNDAIDLATKQGVDIRNSTIEAFALNTNAKFDIICSFQVLEHINNIDSFIKASLKLLKKGGKFIVAVPNNDLLFFRYHKSQLKNLNHLYTPTKLLNVPPHHMGLWNKSSLLNLQNIYNLKLDNFYFEPLNQHRKNLNENILLDRLGYIGRLTNKFHYKSKSAILQFFFQKEFLYGDTIIAVYSK